MSHGIINKQWVKSSIYYLEPINMWIGDQRFLAMSQLYMMCMRVVAWDPCLPAIVRTDAVTPEGVITTREFYDSIIDSKRSSRTTIFVYSLLNCMQACLIHF